MTQNTDQTTHPGFEGDVTQPEQKRDDFADFAWTYCANLLIDNNPDWRAWLEEGIASSYDDETRQESRRQNIAWFVRTGNWPDIEPVLNCRNISTRDKEVYAIAASLTQFLLTRGDRSTLLEFGQYAGKAGWDAALSRYYHIVSVPDLQRDWQQWARLQ